MGLFEPCTRNAGALRLHSKGAHDRHRWYQENPNFILPIRIIVSPPGLLSCSTENWLFESNNQKVLWKEKKFWHFTCILMKTEMQEITSYYMVLLLSQWWADTNERQSYCRFNARPPSFNTWCNSFFCQTGIPIVSQFPSKLLDLQRWLKDQRA
jgi:hypothetical protein